MDITDYADIINEEIRLIYYTNQDKRWCASFEHGEVKGDGVLIGAYENGKTPDEAIRNYIDRIKGETVVFNAGDKDRRKEFKVPINLEYKEV